MIAGSSSSSCVMTSGFFRSGAAAWLTLPPAFEGEELAQAAERASSARRQRRVATMMNLGWVYGAVIRRRTRCGGEASGPDSTEWSGWRCRRYRRHLQQTAYLPDVE